MSLHNIISNVLNHTDYNRRVRLCSFSINSFRAVFHDNLNRYSNDEIFHARDNFIRNSSLTFRNDVNSLVFRRMVTA